MATMAATRTRTARLPYGYNGYKDTHGKAPLWLQWLQGHARQGSLMNRVMIQTGGRCKHEPIAVGRGWLQGHAPQGCLVNRVTIQTGGRSKARAYSRWLGPATRTRTARAIRTRTTRLPCESSHDPNWLAEQREPIAVGWGPRICSGYKDTHRKGYKGHAPQGCPGESSHDPNWLAGASMSLSPLAGAHYLFGAKHDRDKLFRQPA